MKRTNRNLTVGRIAGQTVGRTAALKASLQLLVLVLVSGLAMTAGAQGSQPIVGRKAAAKYFERRPNQAIDVSDQDDEVVNTRSGSRGSANSGSDSGSGGELMMLGLGSFVNSTAYNWKGTDKRDNVGRLSYGVTYLFDAWSKIDTNLRLDFNEYKLDDDRAVKLSIMPMWTFPQFDSRFPIYFGFGVGLGVFFVQVPDESNLSLDYQLVAGTRFLDLYENFGFFVELALKNHLHLLSDGQFNGTALTAGAAFTF